MKPEFSDRKHCVGGRRVGRVTRPLAFCPEPAGQLRAKEIMLPVVESNMRSKCDPRQETERAYLSWRVLRAGHASRITHHASAFTLIELLVVIAIIGILAALTMGAVSRAKNSASKVTDLNNLKQIMVAVHVYTSDSHDVMPPPNWDGGKGLGWLYNCDAAGSGPTTFDPKGGLLWPLLHAPKVYVCPSDNLQMWHWSDHDQASVQRQQQLSSYAMNGAVVGYMSMVNPPVKISAFRSDDCAFWETDETEPYNFNDGANYPPEGVSGRHLQGGIQAAFDTSVSYVKLDKWCEDEADKNKNRLWCYPFSADGGDPNAPRN